MAEGTLKGRAVKASILELVGFAGAQVLRFASSLILSRLLFPEAFGLAALVSIFTFGLVMLSDVGLLESVVQNKRGDDQRFLDTAWTLQVARGVLLWLMACVLAWPMALAYGQPELSWMLVVGSSSLLILGFSSTSLFTLRRRMASGQLVRMELAAQGFGLVVTVPFAYWFPSAWAIVTGGLASAVYRTVASHLIDVGYRNRLGWDAEARHAIVSFGKWIFASSAFEFFSRQGDRLLLGHYLGVATLGVYSIASLLAEALGSATARISHSVLFPLFSQIRRDDPARLRELYYKTRLRLDLFGLVPIGMCMVLSQTLVDVLYDHRYQEAGWMLRLLCVRVAMGTILVPLSTCLFSSGHTQYGLIQNAVRVIWILVGIPLAWSQWGVQGVVWTAATCELPALVVLWRAFHKLGLLMPRRELIAVAAVVVGLMLGWAVDAGFQWLSWRFRWRF